jgi:hypothetical protein
MEEQICDPSQEEAYESTTLHLDDKVYSELGTILKNPQIHLCQRFRALFLLYAI